MKMRMWIAAVLVAGALAPAWVEAGSGQQAFGEGFELIKAGKLSEAAAKFEKGLKAEPDNAQAHYYLAEAYLGLKQNDKAKAHYQKSLQLDPFGAVAQDANNRLAQLSGGGATKSSGAGSSKASSSRYVINGGEVYDKKTDLTWQRCSVGQRWKEDIGCAGVIKTFSWEDAQQLTSGSWRVPTKQELATLVDKSRDDWPTIDREVFPDTDFSHYWTSKPRRIQLLQLLVRRLPRRQRRRRQGPWYLSVRRSSLRCSVGARRTVILTFSIGASGG
jgi:Protein of unknown function (DUF1566)/Tetratricopeptide repeat